MQERTPDQDTGIRPRGREGFGRPNRELRDTRADNHETNTTWIGSDGFKLPLGWWIAAGTYQL